MAKPTKPKGPMTPERPKPIWTEVRLQAPMLAAARHTCQVIVSRPPVVGDKGLKVPHVKIIVAAAKAGLALTEREYETIVRIEATGAEWRLRVPILSASKLDMAQHEYDEIVRELIDLGWLRVSGGSLKAAARYGLADPR